MRDNETVSNPKTIFGNSTLEVLGVNSYDDIEMLNGWEKKGGETYVTDFLLSIGGIQRHLIAKACTKFGASAVIEEWLGRRCQLNANGVRVPELHVSHSATIVEEFIPYTFSEAYALASNNESQHKLHLSYIDTYKRIQGAGFKPISLHDLRSHGDDTVVTDVGFDLGSAHPILECDLDIPDDAQEHFLRAVGK